VIPNFVDDPGVDVTDTDTDLINIGTLEPRKNQVYLIEILAAAKRRGVRLTLTLVGDGPDRSALERAATTHGVSDAVRFAGFVHNGASLLPRHRAYVHAARIENLPLSLVEALAAGRPVFCPAVGGIPEVFSDGIEGAYMPLDAPDAAASTIIHGLRDHEVAMRQRARERFLLGFETTVTASRLFDHLQACAS
jgi:glycosyltransferase involved in cell wall biosynthesis